MRTIGLYGLGGSSAVRLTQLRSPGCQDAGPACQRLASLPALSPAAPALGAVAPNPTASEVPAAPGSSV